MICVVWRIKMGVQDMSSNTLTMPSFDGATYTLPLGSVNGNLPIHQAVVKKKIKLKCFGTAIMSAQDASLRRRLSNDYGGEMRSPVSSNALTLAI